MAGRPFGTWDQPPFRDEAAIDPFNMSSGPQFNPTGMTAGLNKGAGTPAAGMTGTGGTQGTPHPIALILQLLMSGQKNPQHAQLLQQILQMLGGKMNG